MDFLEFRWLDAIDILLVSVLLYQLYLLVRGTVAIKIFFGILAVYLLWLIVKALNMQLLDSILGQFIGVGMIALIIVFQQEIRRFLLMIGNTSWLNNKGFGKQLITLRWRPKKEQLLDIPAIITACNKMAQEKTGALIVIAKDSGLEYYSGTGDRIDARISVRLLESIFYKNSPLHDGAVIIAENRVKAARCVLPVTEKEDFPAHLGMRHRAAVGITENSDTVALIVSEQTGNISFVKNGILQLEISPERMKTLLEQEFSR